jgi:hypothetical protein
MNGAICEFGELKCTPSRPYLVNCGAGEMLRSNAQDSDGAETPKADLHFLQPAGDHLGGAAGAKGKREDLGKVGSSN